MKTRKKDPDALFRKKLAPLAELLVQATPERRRELVEGILATAIPTCLRLLAELLVARLDEDDSQVGAADALVALGPGMVPTLKWSILDKPPEVRLIRLAPVLAVLGWRLPVGDRTLLQSHLLIVGTRAPTPHSQSVLWAAAGCLRDPSPDVTASAAPCPA